LDLQRHVGQNSDLLGWSAALRSSPGKFPIQRIAGGPAKKDCDELAGEGNSKATKMKIRDCQMCRDPSEADIRRRCDADTNGGHEYERQKSADQAQTLVLLIRERPHVVENEVTHSRYDICQSRLYPASLRRICEEECHRA